MIIIGHIHLLYNYLYPQLPVDRSIDRQIDMCLGELSRVQWLAGTLALWHSSGTN